MPTYKYVCDTCSEGFEVERSMKDDPLKKCPFCDGEKVRQIISGGGGFSLPGPDWSGPGRPAKKHKVDKKKLKKIPPTWNR